jgi:hypothetical protein
VLNPDHRSHGVASAELDGTTVDARAIPLADDGGQHTVTIVLGDESAMTMRIAATGAVEQRHDAP